MFGKSGIINQANKSQECHPSPLIEEEIVGMLASRAAKYRPKS